MAKKTAAKSAPSPKATPKKRSPKKVSADQRTTSKVHTETEEREYVQTEFIKRHNIPTVVIKAAQEYESARASGVKANDKTDTKKKNVMALMTEHQVTRVPIERGNKSKMLHLVEEEALKVEAPPKSVD